ncbi:MAG: hypothetical protein JWR19_973, partial [Pedosphaera sp.]|nr:hypothetical protein [Pedosphaera sp.]
MEFVGPGVARVAWVSGVHWDSVGSNAPATVGWAELERSNAEGATNLAIMRQAMEHPAPDSG